MDTYDLIPHPDFPSHAATAIRVHLARPTSNLVRLSYLTTAPLSDLYLPAGKPPARRDELWRTTCFELFVLGPDGYCEFNLSPSSEWAAYAFTGYREGMHQLDIAPPVVDQNGGSQWHELIAEIALPSVTDNAAIGLTAVIEAKGGTKSYWALTHAPGPPDFHNATSFVARLPASQRAQ